MNLRKSPTMTETSNSTIGNVIVPEYNLIDNDTIANSTIDEQSDYDAYGAMQFIVATVTVYAAMGVFCILVSNIRKKSSKQIQQMQDDAVLKYLKAEKDLRLKGFHMQLKTLRNKYTTMVQEYEEKMRLIEIRKELETMDSTPPPVKRSRNTRRLSLFNIHSGKKDKYSGKKRPSMDNALGKMGLSLLHVMKTPPDLHEEEEEGAAEERRAQDSASDIFKSFKESDRESAVSVTDTVKNSPDSHVVDIEHFTEGEVVARDESETLLPPVSSHLSESV